MVAHQPLVNGPRRGFLAHSLARARPRLSPAEVRAARQGEHGARRPLAASSRPLLPHLAPARPLAAPHAAPGHPGRRALGSTPHGRRAGAWSDGERRGTDGAASARIGGGRLGELRQLGWGCRRAALCWRTAPRRRRRQPLTLLYVVDTLLPCTGERGAVRPASPRPRLCSVIAGSSTIVAKCPKESPAVVSRPLMRSMGRPCVLGLSRFIL